MSARILTGCALAMLPTLDAGSVQTCVTSPPYWGLRDYGHADQIGLERTPDEYVARLVEVFREVRRVLRDDGTLWLNLGDSYTGSATSGGASTSQLNEPMESFVARSARLPVKRADGLKPKDLIGIPWRVAFALQADGWYLRSDIIWAKPNPMPESVTDRPTKAHEYLFLLSKRPTYFYDSEAIAEPSIWADDPRSRKGRIPYGGKRNGDAGTGQESFVSIATTRNARTVWTVATQPYSGAHFATFPPALIEPCILAGSRRGDTVLDPFLGAGTTAVVADRLGRDCVGVELNPEYVALARRRLTDDAGMFATVEVTA